MRGTPEECWKAKSELLARIGKRVKRDAPGTPMLGWTMVGTAFAPSVDLRVETTADYGWVVQGLADEETPDNRRLRRGTRIVFTGGEQEQCPGGPGENILTLSVDPDGTAAPSGKYVIPYDLRWAFGALLAEHVLVRADDPLLLDDLRLDVIAADVGALIAGAPRIAFDWH
jgi:hypothetical protein